MSRTTASPVVQQSSDIWEYVSPTRLNTWLRCPLAFRLRYVDGIVPPTSPALFVGQMTHRTLEYFYRHRQLGIELQPDEVVDYLHDEWLGASIDVAFQSTADEEASRQLVDRLIRCYLSQVPDEAPPLAVETCLEAPLVDPDTGEDLGIPLVGVLDLVCDGPLIVDVQTTSRGGRPLDQLNEIRLSCYAYLLQYVTGSPETALEIRALVKTKTPRIEVHRYDARKAVHFRRLLAVIWAYLDALDSGRFIFRPGIACRLSTIAGRSSSGMGHRSATARWSSRASLNLST